MIADAFREKKFDVYEEIQGIADNGSNRRVDILVINRKKNEAIIIDPTIRFEKSKTQPEEVDEEKRKIYEPTTTFYREKYNVKKIKVIGLFVGSRGTITTFFSDFWKNTN